MASLFDVFGRLLLENGGREFVADAAKAGEQAGKAAGQATAKGVSSSMRSMLGTGLKSVGLAASLALGAATKGALQLEEATARYRAETGATAEEAKRAGDTINRVAGSQRQSLEAVTEVAIRVKRDLGAVGDEADGLTEQFVKFARVTRQDAGGAVEAFDDIIDSWGLTLEDTRGVMDKLLVSQQRFGGSIEDSQRTLAALAPAMRAANLEIDDGVALLGLFGAKGLDANAASAAFAKALTKVKSPEELQYLIDDISATEDPFERATKAADLFGSRAGAKLANALGGAQLDDYVIDMADAAGATERAAEALDSTFSAQVQKKISEVGAAIRGLGADFGPVLTGTAALASLGGSLGLDRVLAKGFGKLAGSALVRGAAGKAGLAIGLVFSGAMFAVDQLSSVLSTSLGKLPGAGKIKGAAGKAGNLLGGTLGTLAAAAFAAVMVFEVFETYNRIKAELNAQSAEIGKNVSSQIRQATDAELSTTRDALVQGLKDLNTVWDAGIFTTDQRKALEAQLAEVEAEFARRSAGIPKAVGDELAAGQGAVTEGADAMMDGVPGELEAAADEAGATAQLTPQAVADGIREKRNAVDAAMSALTDAIANAMSPAKERAKLIGHLTGKTLAEALKSKDPAVRAQAVATRQVMLDRLAELTPKSGKIGKSASALLAKGLKSKDPEIRAAANKVKNTITTKLQATQGPARRAGAVAGSEYIKRLRAVVSSATILARFRVSSSGGGAGTIGGRASGGPVQANVPVKVGERGEEIFVPQVDGYVLNHAQTLAAERTGTPLAAPAAKGDTYNMPLTVQGALPVRTIRDISREMQRVAQLGLVPPKRLAPMYPRREARSSA